MAGLASTPYTSVTLSYRHYTVKVQRRGRHRGTGPRLRRHPDPGPPSEECYFLAAGGSSTYHGQIAFDPTCLVPF